MNCLEFRRQLLTDPFSKDEAVLTHEDQCTECAGFARNLRAQEVRMRSLLLDVAPPEGLAERVKLATRSEQGASTRRRWWYSAAATVLLTIGVSMVSLMTSSLERGNVALAQSVLNHIEDESAHLREAHPVSDGRLKWVFRRFGAQLVADIGQVNFAAECLMRKKNGVHLVLPGKVGPITVFFMPGEIQDAIMPVKSERFDGQIVPTDWGSIAVVGEHGEPLQQLGERLAAAVDWPVDQVVRSDLAGASLSVGLTVAQQQNG